MVNYIEDREKLDKILNESSDILKLDFCIGGKSSVMFYVDGLSDKELMDRNIIEPLKKLEFLGESIIDSLNRAIFIADPIIVPKDINDTALKIADGDIALLIDGAPEFYILSMKNYKMRSISEPPVSTVLRGPREGFVEDMKTNMTMLRRRLRTPALKFKNIKLGRFTETNIAIAWLEGVADQTIVDEVNKRLNSIDIDGIVDSSYISRYLEEYKYSIFTQVGNSEKPDIIAAKVLEGRIAIIVDGSPAVLTVPFVLLEHLQSSEDYYTSSYRATITRIIRIFALLIAITLPGIYVALQEFQYQMLPLKMLIAIMNSLQGVPLTPTLEMLILLLLFEVLNEATIRMPRYVGTAISIVGAIVLGETAVNAGLLSTPAVLVSAVSTIGLYGVPDETASSSILRLFFVVIAGVLGLFGVLLASVVLVCYLSSLKSFGTSYLAPFTPMLPRDFHDAVFKSNLMDINNRPQSIPNQNSRRLKDDREQ